VLAKLSNKTIADRTPAKGSPSHGWRTGYA